MFSHLSKKLIFALIPQAILILILIFSFSGSTQLQKYLIILIGFFSLLTFFIVVKVSNSITHSLTTLLQNINELAKGNFDVKSNIKSGDDLEKISNSFNLTAASLKETIHKLQLQQTTSQTTNSEMVKTDQNLKVINTELEKEKESIKDEKDRLALILAGISDMVIAVDTSGSITTFNKASEVSLGIPQASALGKSLSDLIRVFDKQNEVFVTEYCPTQPSNPTNNGAFVKKGLKVVVIGSGKELYVDWARGNIEGSNMGCIVTLHDISAQKQLEDMKLDFVSMAAHELRTPLTSIRGYLSVFLKENEGKLNADQSMFLNRIYESSQHLMSLVDNLLTVSKIEKNVSSIHPEPVDWMAHLGPIITELLPRATEKKITLTLTPTTEIIPPVLADKIRITEVVTNLINNAINYTHPDGNIRVWVDTQDNFVVTHIADTGLGIPKEAMAHLFTKFFRVTHAFEKTSKGTGLGLYISKSIIDLHQGKIWVDSVVGKGSIFNFALPIQPK